MVFKGIKVYHTLQLKGSIRSQSRITVKYIQYRSKNVRDLALVLKSPKSAGSNLVFKCNTLEDVKNKYLTILNTKDMFDAYADYVLIEELIDGDEYIVNTLSYNNKTEIIDIWKYTKIEKNNAPFLYYEMRLENDISNPEIKKLIEYSKSVVKGVGIEYGPAHIEIRLSSSGPRLMEVGARLAGAGIPNIVNKCSKNFNYYEEVLNIFSGHGIGIIESYNKFKFATILIFSSDNEGILSHIEGLSAIRSLDSFVSDDVRININEFVPMTTDVMTIPYEVSLINRCQKQLERDIQTARESFKIILLN